MKSATALFLRVALLFGLATVLLCQIPADEKLDAKDEQPFHDEIHRLEKLLDTAGDRCTVLYALARTWAAGHQYREAIDTLQKVVALKVGLDPSGDDIFGKLRGTKEFEQLLRQVRQDTPPINKSGVLFRIDEPDLFPEGIAYDRRHKSFFFGSTTKHKIIECARNGACQSFAAAGLDSVLGLKVDPRNDMLWATSNSNTGSALLHYQIPSGKLLARYSVKGAHLFNDIDIDGQGDIFITDTRGATVYWISHKTDRLELFDPTLKVQAANGIAANGQKLYISSFPDGITVVDISTKASHPIEHPRTLCLATIDGLYFFDGSLYAIQNGIMVHRLARFHLTQDLNVIDGFDILERRNPLFNGGPTTAAVSGGALYYMANPQLDKVQDGKIKPGVRLDPIRILKLKLND